MHLVCRSAVLGLALFSNAMPLTSAVRTREKPSLPGVKAPPGFEEMVKPYLAQHCYSCHGEKKQKADFRVDTLVPDFMGPGSAGHWTDVMDRINGNEMPPTKEPRPDSQQSARVTEWLATQLTEAEAKHARFDRRKGLSIPPIISRRVSQYASRSPRGHLRCERSVGVCPRIPTGTVFERIGSVLTLSPAHVEKYYAAGRDSAEGGLWVWVRSRKRTLVRWVPLTQWRVLRGDISRTIATERPPRQSPPRHRAE